MSQLERFLTTAILVSSLAVASTSVALGQDQRIIDGAAIGALVTDNGGCQPRMLTLSLWVANDDPNDVDDTIYEVDVSSGAVIRSIPAPGAHPQGLMAGVLGGDPLGVTLFVTDDDPCNVDDLVYEISALDGSVISSFPASGTTSSLSPRALVQSASVFDVSAPPACAGTGWIEIITAAWIANGDTLCLIDLSDGSNIRSIPAPCSSPQGLEMGFNIISTASLWVACDDDDTIYLVDTSDGSVITSFAAPAANPSGLAMSLVDAEVGGEIVDPLVPLDLWQGENTSDTMENLAVDGSFMRRITPVCAGGSGSELPWSEPFDSYANGSGLHGQGGWAGWDNDPNFDAVVTSVQARSAPHSVQINDKADIVHEFSGANAGRWSFTAHQFIPSNFFDPGSQPFDGTFLVMMNTYAPGVTHVESDFSVQLQFDPTDAMFKAFHGVGISTVNVPYATDRWVEIRVVIDLDSDSTQIYYDGALVTEYPWTGGVTGVGGGALNIAAVDFFANGSTAVWWDDLLLEPVPDCPGDADGSGQVGLSDLALVLSQFGMSGAGLSADVDGDNDVDLSDLAIVLGNFGVVCP